MACQPRLWYTMSQLKREESMETYFWILVVIYLLGGLYAAIDDVIYYQSKKNTGMFAVVKTWPQVVKLSFFLGVLIVNLLFGTFFLIGYGFRQLSRLVHSSKPT